MEMEVETMGYQSTLKSPQSVEAALSAKTINLLINQMNKKKKARASQFSIYIVDN